MAITTGAKEFPLNDTVSQMRDLGIEPPEEIHFPFTIKLDEKYAAHFALKGLVLRSGVYEQAVTCVVTKNQVVQMEKGD